MAPARSLCFLWLVSKLAGVGGKCLCCRSNQQEADEGFCKWWSAKHAKVEALGREVLEGPSSEAARRLYVAYFRTHARLEDPLMWDLFRECPAFNASEHEPLLQGNEHEETAVRLGLEALAGEVQAPAGAHGGNGSGCGGGLGPADGSDAAAGGCGAWATVVARVEAHTASEERLLKESGLLDACEQHLDRRWTEVMEETHQDAKILYEEFRRMGIGLEQILSFVRDMVADWPKFPELRLRTASRMRQVRHRMPDLLAGPMGADMLAQVTPGVAMEYARWVQLERAEGLALDAQEELSLHLSLLPRLLAARPLEALGLTLGALVATASGAVGFFLLRGTKARGL